MAAPGNEASAVIIVFVRCSAFRPHCVRLAGTRLPVGEDRNVVALSFRLSHNETPSR